ncbi:tripartite tricarboxylate transporter substrate binding protein [Pigmentiphaga soli]|uniref:tripartite tricarboxylate transporter substrate binding protein n=1 Tax=Pigmentiphaga soli TaxID=1007095 RepID=UPI003CD0AC87
MAAPAFFAATAVAVASAGTGTAGAMDAAGAGAANTVGTAYPARPITIIVTFPPGGGTDLLARRVGAELSSAVGQPVLIENRAGASGNIGARMVAESAPDGYTLLMVNSSFAINPGVFSHLGFDPKADFAPVINMAFAPSVLAVRADSPYRNLPEFLAASRTGAALTYASCGNGTPQHLAGEMLNQATSSKVQHIPYKGCGPALNDVLGGQVASAIVTASSASQFLQSGKLRALAITSKTRSPLLPDVPTVAEQGVPGYELDQWHGFLAPARTPEAVVAKLNRDVRRIIERPAFREQLLQAGFNPAASTPAEFKGMVEGDIDRFGALTRRIGLRAD